jgi:hypothetical protein
MRRKLAFGVLAIVIGLGALAGPGRLGSVRAEDTTNVAIDWNANMVASFTTAAVAPPAALRFGAIVQAAVFDAVNGIEPRYTSIHVAPAAPRGASRQAAAIGAAYEALFRLFPLQQPTLAGYRAASIAKIGTDQDGSSPGIALGLAWGTTVADQIVTWRDGDGLAGPTPVLAGYVQGHAPGDWQPTPPSNALVPVFRRLSITTPFGLTSPSQFRPAGPPALTSAIYATDLNELKVRGGKVSTVRTAYETDTAKLWQNDTPTNQWNRVADTLAQQNELSLLSTARVLALMNIALADAGIAVFDAKNYYNFWRPITAIAAADPGLHWTPLLNTPYHQEYPSAHTGVSSAATTVLAAFFGNETDFTVSALGSPGVLRSFTSFTDAIAQVTDARILAGFHYRFSCLDGITLGTRVAGQDLSTLMRPLHEKED